MHHSAATAITEKVWEKLCKAVEVVFVIARLMLTNSVVTK